MSKSIHTSPAAFAAAIAGACVVSAPAAAHGFGQRYDLPLPLSLYLFGTAAAIVLSFVVVGLFARHAPGVQGYPRLELLAHPRVRSIANLLILVPLKLLAVGLLALTIIAGLLGDQNPFRNIAPTLFWIIFWVGFAQLAAFGGNLWALVNPWRNLFDWADGLCRRITGRSLAWAMPYPEAVGLWPAVALLLAVSWIELVYPSPALPATIAWLALFYSLLMGAGMAAFGAEVWIERGDVFSVFFGLFARFSPTEPGVRDGGGRRGLALRPFGAGLIAGEKASASAVAFVLLVLSSVLFDGALTTPEWAEAERALVGLLPGNAALAILAVRSAGLGAFWGMFLGAYLGVSWAMSKLATSRSPGEMARGFVFTLVPIAIAYHLAHYLAYLMTQGQYIVPLASDPLGFGWNLLGTAGYRVDITIVGARFQWYAAVIAIVIGHMAAVYLADVRAHQLFPTRRDALSAQVPLTALMVAYTFVSLSILAEPIVERRPSAEPSAVAQVIPDAALLPEPGTGRLLPVGPGRSARLKLSYRVLGSVFHDETRMTEADLLYAYMFAYRWAVRGEDGAHYDPSVEAATAPLRERLAAIRVTGVDTVSKSFRIADVDFVRELFMVDVYADVPPEDPEQDAIFVPPWSTLPWHLIVLMEEAVGRGWAAFSEAESRRRGVEWLDLVRSEELKVKLALLVDAFTRDGFRPDALRSLVSAEEARKRWSSLAQFYRTHGHFLVTNGPYLVKSWAAERATLTAFRDLSYPLGVGSYDTYAIPRRGFVAKAERESGGLRLFAEIETVMKFMRDYRIERQPVQALDAVAFSRAQPECRYVVVDDGGRVVLAGVAHTQDDRSFRLSLDDELPAGTYTVMVEIVVNGNAMNAPIENIHITVGGR
ncbi:MAG: hypothetical protein HYR63_14000 [Proteobacteria bacterium]|nr:hypothetical protein [Pseudomonadota bacterium]